MSLSNKAQWVAVYTAPRHEKTVTDRIAEETGLETYLPMHRVLRKWSDRMKLVQVPLIPSYTFVKMAETNIYSVHNIHGVCGFVKFKNTGIAVIPEREMAALKQVADSEEAIHLHNTQQLKIGASVKITAGPFEGLFGTIVKDCHEGNFSIQISNLNLSLVMDIEADILQVTK